MQEGNVVEEGSHEELWSNADTVYHSLVALQEAATDRREKLSAGDLEDIVKKDAELAELAAAEAAKEASKRRSSLSGREESHFNGSDHPSKKSIASGKKISARGDTKKEEEEALVRIALSEALLLELYS
jgi:ABC-type dipeptide/oligopeptide/nickel transport system ATPase component